MVFWRTLILLIENFIALFTETAPYLLLGMLIAGMIHQWLPNEWIVSTLGGSTSSVDSNVVDKKQGSMRPVITAALIGAPLPLCSCSVIPVAMGIRRSGASKASTASFLVSTPETGVDSIGITYALMGLPMAIARPIAAIVSAIITGMTIALWGKEEPVKHDTEKTTSSCCHAKSTCGNTSSETTNTVKDAPKQHWLSSVKAVLAYGFDKLLVDFMKWLLIGLFFAALVLTYVPSNWMASYGSGPLAMLVMVVISIPMYICATASTPVAVGLMLAGISPGAALVFMLTGPATNIATLMIIKNELGRRELILYLCALISSALLAGWAVDAIFNYYDISMQLVHGSHDDMIGSVHQLSALVLFGLMIWQVIKWLRK
jgi:uncharacterized membrane protein YraQ (UPF0718 family)